jgi:hypothetical protein
MDQSKIIISYNSFMPTGFIGWSELASVLLQKYSCKILAPLDFSEKEKLLKYFEGTDHQLNDDAFIDRLDHTDSEITFLALEPASETIIPSTFSGKVFGAICGPGSRNWEKQIEVLQERNVTGFLSEVLPDELSSGVSNNDLEYFCAKALFLPPCLGNGKASKSNPTYETIIIKESDEGSGNPTGSGSKLKRVLPILEQMEGFQTIDFSHDTDFSVFNEECNKSKAVYNFLHYPQLNLFFKLNRPSQAILNKEHLLDSPLRNFLADYSLFEFESNNQLKQPSVRAQTLELLSKNKQETQGISGDVLSQFSASALLPKLEQMLGIGDVPSQGDRLDYLHKVTTWASLQKSNVHLKQSPYVPITNEITDCCVDVYRHPACSSALESLFREKIDFAGTVFLNSTFAQKVLSLPNSAGVTHLFKELMEYDADKWIRICENSLTQSNAYRFAELLYFTCLLAKDESSQKEHIKIAQSCCDQLMRNNANFRIKAFAYKAKLKLLNTGNKLCMEDFPGWESQLQAYAEVAYEVNQQELFMPSFRSDAKEFLDQFIELFFRSPNNATPNSQVWITLLTASGRLEEGNKIIRNLISSRTIPAARILHYFCCFYFASCDSRKFLLLVDQFEKELSSFRPFNFWSRLYMLLLSTLKADSPRIHQMAEELLTEHKHISSITPIPISSFLIFLHVGKTLQSQEIQDEALLQGSNYFFTYLNMQDFGEIQFSLDKDSSSSIISKLTEFLQD